jgi:hypothetical protein
MADFDQAVADGKLNRLHRVATRLFSKDGVFRPSFERYADGFASLEELPDLQAELLAINLTSLVERRIEGEHARIKQYGLGKEGSVTPATIAALLRMPETFRLLDLPAFVAWATALWSKPLVVHKSLTFLLPVKVLARKTLSQLYKLIYLYDKEVHFRDTAEEEHQQGDWEKAVAAKTSALVASLQWQERLFLEYIKHRAHDARTIAIPLALCDAMPLGLDEAVLDVRAFSSAELSASVCDSLAVPSAVSEPGGLQFLRVVNAWPERRFAALPAHVDRSASLTAVDLLDAEFDGPTNLFPAPLPCTSQPKPPVQGHYNSISHIEATNLFCHTCFLGLDWVCNVS